MNVVPLVRTCPAPGPRIRASVVLVTAPTLVVAVPSLVLAAGGEPLVLSSISSPVIRVPLKTSLMKIWLVLLAGSVMFVAGHSQ